MGKSCCLTGPKAPAFLIYNSHTVTFSVIMCVLQLKFYRRAAKFMPKFNLVVRVSIVLSVRCAYCTPTAISAQLNLLLLSFSSL